MASIAQHNSNSERYFAALAVAGIGMAVGSRILADPFDQIVLIAVGVAIFGASLAFFLVRVFSMLEK